MCLTRNMRFALAIDDGKHLRAGWSACRLRPSLGSLTPVWVESFSRLAPPWTAGQLCSVRSDGNIGLYLAENG